MELIEFKEQTIIIAEDQPEYLPLPAYRDINDPEGKIICCWKLSWKERFEILFNGIIWHSVLTFNSPLQPQLLTCEKPEMGNP